MFVHHFAAFILLGEAGLAEETIEAMLRRYPSIKGINYDLPHVVATAPHLLGVEHMGGDIFETVPSADVMFMKWNMHDWGDEDCIKILKSCRKAIPKTGKLIIIDVVALDSNQTGGDNNNGGQKEKLVLDPNLVLVFDLVMVVHYFGGKERTEKEWKKILLEGGFGRYKIITFPDFQFMIEAFPS